MLAALDGRRDLAGRESALAELNAVVQSLQERHRAAGDSWQQVSSALADREARSAVLAELQAKIDSSKDSAAWLAGKGLQKAPRLWQQLDIERGWEDALEAVLRERLNALELPSLDAALAWIDPDVALPGRVAAYAPATGNVPSKPPFDALLAKVKTVRSELSRVLIDWLDNVRCRDDLESALRDRAALGPGEGFVTLAGHIVSADAVSFFAPDSELHGVIARQRELAELAQAIVIARADTEVAATARTAAENDLKARQQEYHAESMAMSSQQRRCHDLELELMQLRQAAETAQRRRAQIADELAALVLDEASERESLAATDVEVNISRRQLAEATQQQESSRRIVELNRRREGIEAQIAQQQALVAQVADERRQIDWSPVEASLQAQLASRAAAEQALAAARDRQESLASEMRLADEARLTIDQRLDPARARIEEIRLKEQAAVLSEEMYTQQLDEAHADLGSLPEQLKAWGRASTLPGEIERLTQVIAALGPVNLAALDELSQTAERKQYLDAQAQDLTEAMTTLQSAIRQIDRESRELLQQTFDSVNVNFGKLFPTLFGGGQARLVLSGEEILDSGVQVIAQPPGKRNTSIHLLSGGEKSLTAIALVFALFQLNPAPFCLLDEVDAPLDDPNTDRFCALVRTMAEVTQFLFISHNKITMEMANQLVGITMPDPGVSRVVAVDIAEALELAETTAS